MKGKKEKNTDQENLKEYYDEYWIRSGIKVVLVSELHRENRLDITVDFLMRKGIGTGENRKNIVTGVMTHWMGVGECDNQKYYRGRFDTKELYPKAILDAGTNEMRKWEEFQQELKMGKKWKEKQK